MSIIQVKNLVKRYRKADRNAIDDISFSVEPGEFFALLGPNGAGKTTTISILTTTLAKTSGQIKIADYDLDKESSKVRANLGIIFQNPSLDLNLSAEENIRFHCFLYGLYSFRPSYSLMPKSYKKRVDELAQVMGLDQQIFKPVKTFSGGMKRKLEIIRSLMHQPKVLFLDEPTSGLDPASRRNLWEYLKQVRDQQKITVFLTTHYLEEAEGADRVLIINNGQIIESGSPSQIKRRLVENYLLVQTDKITALLSELDKLKIDYQLRDDAIKISLNKLNVHQTLQKIKTPLTNVQTHTPTLEDAYLESLNRTTPETTNNHHEGKVDE